MIFVGDAAMSPYEIAQPGGANEHWNAESGETWLRRLLDAWPQAIWINPMPRGGLGLLAVGGDDRGDLRRADVPDDAGRARGGDPGAGAVSAPG